MGGGGALGAGLHDEILVVAGEAREPVQHLQSIKTTPRHIPRHRLAQREREGGQGSEGGGALTGMLDAGDGGM